MKTRYLEWIMHHEYDKPEVAKNKCEIATEKLVKDFPELKRVRGWMNGDQHWWCVDEEGDIVDPTLSQYSYTNTYTYKIFREGLDEDPLGKCMNCGEYCWESQYASPFACSEDCEKILETRYNSLLKGNQYA